MGLVISYMRFFALLVSIFFFIVNISICQNSITNTINTYKLEQRFENISIEQGLSQSVINSILQDSRGFLWFGTQDGLNRFDGYEFKIYRASTIDTASISNNLINHIMEDKAGKLWISTSDGLNVWNPLTESFKSYFHQPNQNKSLANNRAFRTIQDKNGSIWVVSQNALSKYLPEKDAFINFSIDSFPQNYGLQTNMPIITDHAGDIWIGTPQGIRIFNPNKEEFNIFTNVPFSNSKYLLNNHTIWSIFEDKYGIFWVGTNRGLYKYDIIKRKFHKIENIKQDTTDFFNSEIRCIVSGPEGNLWLGSYGKGLALFDRKAKIIRQYQTDADNPFSLASNYILDIMLDNTGTIWIGTWGKGINKIDNKENKFYHYFAFPHQKNVNSNDVSSIHKDNKYLWIGTWGSGLIRQSNKNHNTNVFNHQQSGKYFIPTFDINAIYKDTKGILWIATGNGVAWFNNKLEKFVFIQRDTSKIPNTLSNNEVTCITEDKYGYLWLGSKNGLMRYDHQAKTFITYNAQNSNLSSNFIYSLVFSGSQDLWIGTYNGLNKLNIETEEIAVFKSEKNNTNSISNDIILSICKENDSIIWVGTFYGLNKFNTIKYNNEVYTVNDGLANNVIYDILIDKNKNIWVSTNKGISKIVLENMQIFNYDTKDGLQSYEFNKGAGYKDKNNTLYFGGINGYNAFNTDSIYKNQYIPPVIITKLKIDNENFKTDTNISLKKQIVLKYKTKFSLEFSALNYTRPEKNNYAYMLEGLDENWNYCENRRFVNYENLSPGKYIFRVKASNNDKIWNEKGTQITIIITPPFYKTFWFYLIIAALIIGLLKLYIDTRTRALRKKNNILLEKQLIAQKVAEQKEELAIKNKDIIDSLNYAQRIQNGIMASERQIREVYPESFVYFKPKEIVSGDFFWFLNKEETVYIAAVDCTGHGVPGAIMSIAANALLNQSLNEHNLINPNRILEDLNRGVIKTFEGTEDTNIKDGMDIALISINKTTGKLVFSGAYNPIYYIHNGTLTQIKGDRYPIGLFTEDEIEGFTNHEIQLQKDDIIFIFTDGYADQFGGESGKKFKYHRFKKMLLENHNLPMQEQKQIIEQTMLDWKGNLEQIDDMLIIGLRF